MSKENTIFLLEDGSVAQVEEWVQWSGEDVCVLNITRKEGGTFTSDISDMRDPYTRRHLEGTFDEVLDGVHPAVRDGFNVLFSTSNPDIQSEKLRHYGFDSYVVRKRA